MTQGTTAHNWHDCHSATGNLSPHTTLFPSPPFLPVQSNSSGPQGETSTQGQHIATEASHCPDYRDCEGLLGWLSGATTEEQQTESQSQAQGQMLHLQPVASFHHLGKLPKAIKSTDISIFYNSVCSNLIFASLLQKQNSGLINQSLGTAVDQYNGQILIPITL